MAFSPRTHGQMMALFMLVGIVILFLMGMFIFLKGATRGENIERLAIRATGASSFREHAESCLRYETLNAVDTYGLLDGQEPYIEAAVRRNLPKCIEWDFYEQEGFDITVGELAVTATITEDALVVETDYAITGEDQTGQFALEGLDFSLPRENAAALSFDGAGKTDVEVVITSTDGDAELIIPEGVTVTDGDGNPVEEVAVRMLERDFNGLENPLAIGMVVYEVVPHVTFSEPVTLRVRYRDADVPSGIAEEDIRLAQFDERTGLWYSVPTEVDAEQNILDARFTSFSPATPVKRCTAEDLSNRIEFPISQFEGGLVFLQDCGDAETCALGDGWKVTEEGLSELSLEADETGSLKIVAPERGEDGAFKAEEKPYNQVPLSGCAIRDWDKDDTELLAGGIETDVTGCTVDDGEDCEGTVEAGVSGEELLQACRESIERYKAEHADYAARFELSAAGGSTGDVMRDHVPYTDTEFSGCSCTLRAVRPSGTDEVTGGEIGSCTPVKATAPTYGYPAVEGVGDVKGLPGGFAILRFRIPGNGGGCIATDGEENLRVEIGVETSTGDTYEVKINPLASMDAGGELSSSQGLAAPVDELTGRPEAGYTPADGEAAALRQQWDGLGGDYETGGSGEYEVYAGGTFYNDVYIKVEDANGDGCAKATLDSFAIYGAGISFDVPRTYERCTVTVQDRINYLCDCDTPGCTGDWGVGSELSLLANWRGAWNPTAGSIVNGQTLLCDLDQNDGRLQGLMEEGWSPFGGKCGEGPMLPVIEGGVCGDEDITACDYEHNVVMKCAAAEASPPASGPAAAADDDDDVVERRNLLDAEVVSYPSATGFTLSPGDDGGGTTTTTGTVWTVVSECGEEDICRIIGDAATCVGAIDLPTECTRFCDSESYPYDVLDDGACYECVGTAQGGCYGSAISTPGTWKLRDNLDPGSLGPICQPYYGTCVNDEVSGIVRECREEGCGGGWIRYEEGDFECTNPALGPQCCERPRDRTSLCPPDSTYSRTGTACEDNDVFSCRQAGHVSAVCCDGSLYTKTCARGTCEDGRCQIMPAPAAGCSDISHCEEYIATTVSDIPGDYGWEYHCQGNTCDVAEGCMINGDSCQTLGTDCPPLREGGEIMVGVSGDIGDHTWGMTGCYECSRTENPAVPAQWFNTFDTDCTCADGNLQECECVDGSRPDPIGENPHWYGTRCVECTTQETLVNTVGCGCVNGGTTYDVNDYKWFNSQCNRCRGTSSLTDWIRTEETINCGEVACDWSLPYVALAQGQTICLGRWDNKDHIATCSMIGGQPANSPYDSSRPAPITDCQRGCSEGQINPDCGCTGNSCPDCLACTGTSCDAGWPTVSGQNGEINMRYENCFVCQDSAWTPSATACWCPAMGDGRPLGEPNQYYWIEGAGPNDKCWHCTQDRNWKSVQLSDCPESRCGSFSFNEWKCIDYGTGQYGITRCDGGSWEDEQKCWRVCTNGQSVPPSGEGGSAPCYCCNPNIEGDCAGCPAP